MFLLCSIPNLEAAMSKAERTEQPDNWQSLGAILAGLALARPPASATVHALAPRRPAEPLAVRQPQAA